MSSSTSLSIRQKLESGDPFIISETLREAEEWIQKRLREQRWHKVQEARIGMGLRAAPFQTRDERQGFLEGEFDDLLLELLKHPNVQVWAHAGFVLEALPHGYHALLKHLGFAFDDIPPEAEDPTRIGELLLECARSSTQLEIADMRLLLLNSKSACFSSAIEQAKRM